MSVPSELLAIETSFPKAHSMLRVLEPATSCPQTLQERIFAGTYDKPFILDSGRWRFLHFDFNNVQSAMSLEEPDKLSLAYTRKMMAFLLFNDAPARILLLGLGGGSLAKFCYRKLPSAAVTAIEMNPDVIRLREEFHVPKDDARFRVVCADGARYVARLRRTKDVILADACDRAGVAPQLNDIRFYKQVRRNLAQGGVFVSNLCGDDKNFNSHLSKIHDAFDGQLLTLQVAPPLGNVIVIAFKETRPEIDWPRLEAIAPILKHRFDLNFPRFARRLASDSRLRTWLN
jgi:spermidine synthase